MPNESATIGEVTKTYTKKTRTIRFSEEELTLYLIKKYGKKDEKVTVDYYISCDVLHEITIKCVTEYETES